MKKKRILGLLLALTMMAAAFTGCGNNNNDSNEQDAGVNTNDIIIVSREEGSGTRGAFIELFGIEQKNDKGEKEDMTTLDAAITNSTSVMMTSVAGNKDGIGYISLGSLNDTVKAIKINGAAPTVDNIKNGSYEIARPFNIVTTSVISDVALDFVNFIMSAEGQAVIEETGYISSDGEAFAGTSPSGKVVVAGSSSVTPVMEKLKEAYILINPNVTIEIQQSDSTTGVNSTIQGICDIGMVSRELKDSEKEKGVTPTVIAMDGIAVIVNNDNQVEDLSKDQIKAIYTGEITNWADVAA